jgi:hypothetical protein
MLVLYTSGYTQNAIVHNGKLDDDAFLLSKPYRKDELARKLRSVFAGTARGAISPPAAPFPTWRDQRRGKVLVVEDVALIRMTTVDMVSRSASSAEAATAPRRWPCCRRIRHRNPADRSGPAGHERPPAGGRGAALKPGLKVIIASGYSTLRGAM